MPSRPAATAKANQTNPYSPWAARFWHGMLCGDWLRMAASHHFRIHPFRWGLAITVTLLSFLGTLLRPLQVLLFGRRIKRTKITQAPIFIIGHWRSGTTMLHELMVLDDRHAFPTTYQCFAPNHFLVSAWIVTKLKFLLPARRPMDNMEAGWGYPQEDEFALCNMGLPSPYLNIAFPNDAPRHLDYLDFRGVPEADVARWKAGLLSFLQRITCRDPKRMVLKSPPHTGRIRTLLEMFPDARFIHIVRDPYSIFPSTVKLWKSLSYVQGFQLPTNEGLEEYVFSRLERMYGAFEADRHLVDPARMYELRYEDLVRDPAGQIRAIYEQLDLDGFSDVLPKIETYMQRHQNYKTNRFELDPALKAEINHRWGAYMRKYGYALEPAVSAAS